MERWLGYQLRRASLAMQADLNRRLGAVNLTLVEMATLQVIEANPLITQSDIGRMLAIKRANMTPMTASLLERGLIARNAIDGRSQGLTLSEAGHAVKKIIDICVAENEARLYALVPETEKDRLIELLRLVWAGLEDT